MPSEVRLAVGSRARPEVALQELSRAAAQALEAPVTWALAARLTPVAAAVPALR
jgi:hypothetical protein